MTLPAGRVVHHSEPRQRALPVSVRFSTELVTDLKGWSRPRNNGTSGPATN
ncbi:hypothetical protein [Streptomyces sp. NPDC005930]|uniref:hypothetical protein n=1 Tax=Streptomyces sp. NPDC005930 TaxID=3364736 RepID=UPI0036C812C0